MYREATIHETTAMTYRSGYLLFVWHGGAYIDVCLPGQGSVWVDGVSYYYGDQCINVWDYMTDSATIEWQNAEQFIGECEAFLSLQEG